MGDDIIRERYNRYRLIVYVSFAVSFLLLLIFTNLSVNMIVIISFTIGLIVFFGYIFKTEGLKKLKFFLIIFSSVFIPLLIIYVSGIFDSLPNPWKGIVITIIVAIFGLSSLIACIKFNLIKTVNSDGYRHLR